jgi:alkylation response protein AidB-like acyl-CoA dehydrogenase
MKNPPVPHPSHFISAFAAGKIRQLSGEAERSGRLHPEQLAIIYDHRWFSLFVPRSYGGLELSLPDGLRTEEGLAWADGSTGWTATLCSGANWFIGFLSPAITQELFSDRRVCFAGSGRASGTAKITASGYEITGRWSYASGAPHATAFTANCQIEKDGAILTSEDGSPMVRAFIFLKEEVIVQEDWNCMGMIATASHSFEVRGRSIPANRCFTIDGNHSFLSQPIYQYPFLQLAETTLAVNSSGMATRFMDLCEEVFAKRSASSASGGNAGSASDGNMRSKPSGNTGLPSAGNSGSASTSNAAGMEKALAFLGEAKARLQNLRNSFYAAAGASWEEHLEKNSAEQALSESTLSEQSLLDAVSNSSRQLAAEARRMVDELYPWCGLSAANPGTEINRVWRNLHTASQHSLLTPRD